MKENMTRFHIAFTTMKCKTKHTISLSSLIKIFCHQEWIEIPFSLSKNICLKSEGKRSERRKFSGACLDKVLFVCLKFVLIRNMGCIGDFRFKLADVQIFLHSFRDVWWYMIYDTLQDFKVVYWLLQRRGNLYGNSNIPFLKRDSKWNLERIMNSRGINVTEKSSKLD